MMVAFFMYGGMTMSIFPRQEEISFEYHLFGALAGVLSAFLWHSLDPKPAVKAYHWEIEPKAEDPVIGDQWRIDGQSEENEGSEQAVPNEKEKHE